MPLRYSKQAPVTLEHAHHDGAGGGRHFVERPPAAIAAILRRVALHAVSMRAGFAGAEAFQKPALEIGGNGVLQLLGLFVHLVPFHAEDFGQHALDQMMPVEHTVGDVAAGRA